MKTNRLLVIVLVLQMITLAGQWLEGPRMPAAHAQPFNAGADRQAMLDEMKKTNDKLDTLISVLNSGNLQVRVQQPDETKDGARGR